MSSKQVYVYISLEGEDILVGRIWSHSRKGRESASFEYDPSWLSHPEKFSLEPALTLTAGQFHTQNHQALFGAIGDSAPDRWGRVLMRRANAQLAKKNHQTPRTLMEIDYLLGVNDVARPGALRFSKEIGGPFLSEKATIPPLVDLPKLLSVTERYLDDEESEQDLKLLLAPGSSLGGARPKASVVDKDDSLAIAKFPRKDDEYNIVAWEWVAHELALKAGITMAKFRLESILDKPVIIINRFDRTDRNRIPFLSAMSMLGAKDNETHSYIEMAYALAQHGAHPNKDMAELWRRVVFSIMISNTDDHLRNHGFLYERQLGWKLSPAYDLNPVPTDIKPRILTTAIDYEDTTASLDVALSVIDEFRLSMSQAKNIIQEVANATKQWRNVARTIGLSNPEIERMQSAFEHDDLVKAQKM